MIRTCRGQALVEVALILPLLGLTTFAGILFLEHCHNMLALQRQALALARKTNSSSKSTLGAGWFTSFQGPHTPALSRRSSHLLSGWKSANGKDVFAQQGYVVRITQTMVLLPNFVFGKFFGPVKEQASVEQVLYPSTQESR